MQSKAATVADYLAELAPDRRREIETVRKVVLASLPDGYVEVMSFGMIAYVVPLARYPKTYNGQPLGIAGLASQKNYMSVYVMCAYTCDGPAAWFTKAWKATGKKLDMGKCCIRFKRADDLALDVLGNALGRLSPDEYIALFEKSRQKR